MYNRWGFSKAAQGPPRARPTQELTRWQAPIHMLISLLAFGHLYNEVRMSGETEGLPGAPGRLVLSLDISPFAPRPSPQAEVLRPGGR